MTSKYITVRRKAIKQIHNELKKFNDPKYEAEFLNKEMWMNDSIEMLGLILEGKAGVKTDDCRR